MKLSIIIINYKTPEMTAECVRSIEAAGILADYEVIVVDNDSDDGSFEQLLVAGLPKTRVVSSGRNGGFSFGNNVGARHATGEYLFFFNSDTLLKPLVLDEMLTYMDCDEGCGALCCQSVDASGSYLNNGHAFPTRVSLIKEVIIRPLVPTRLRATLRGRTHARPLELCTRWDWVSGSGLLMRRALFEGVGGWDEEFFMYMEDVSLCQKIARAGCYCAVYNKLGFVHYLGDGAGSAKVIFEASKSEVVYFRRWRQKDARFAQAMTILRAKQKCRTCAPEVRREIVRKLRAL